MRRNKLMIMILSILILTLLAINNNSVAFADGNETVLEGKNYIVGAKEYMVGLESREVDSPENCIGRIVAKGDYTEILGEDNSFIVNDESFSVYFTLNEELVSHDEDDWHICKDNSRKVEGIKLGASIKTGAIIVEKSPNGKDWVEDKDYIITDILNNEKAKLALFTTNALEVENTYYYRITIAYKLQKKTGAKKVLLFTKDTYEEELHEDVYVIKVAKEDDGITLSADGEPRKVMGTLIKTKGNSGYSEEEKMDKNDVHFRSSTRTLGEFVINGYTSELNEDGTIVFLKNYDDKVALWYTLKEDISAIGGNEKISVIDDNKSTDKVFQYGPADFKRGVLFIRFTDNEGKVHEPIVYTDFLAANATKDIDTRVQLFQEGDYEVRLDYVIKDKSKVVPSNEHYSVSFKFKIRNGNNMVFPFDIGSHKELRDQDYTMNGFMLDFANSKYLKVTVEHRILIKSKTGDLIEETRWQGPVKDGEAFEDPGIYIITFMNSYSGGQPISKTIYVVGDNDDIYYMATGKHLS